MRAPSEDRPDADRWNHNIHYHPLVLDAIPPDATTALDVGCGDGQLTRSLGARGLAATGIDLDEPSIATARAQGGAEYVLGDVLAHGFEPGSFDLVASVATLHHLDARAGLARLAELCAPGGVVVVVGLARSSLPRDLPRELAAAVGTRVLKLRRSYWEHAAPTCWPPPETYDSMARITAEVLPGSSFRRLLLWRYAIEWRRPV